MSDRDVQSYDTLNPYRDFVDDDDFTFERELQAGEPVCAPHERRDDTLLPALFVVIALSLGTFVALQTRVAWQTRVEADRADKASPAVAASPALGLTEPSAAAAILSRDVADAPGAGAGTQVPAIEPAAEQKGTSPPADVNQDLPTNEIAVREPLPAPVVDPADRNQTRAIAVGLNPSLSAGLLTRLSAADYRNAGVAISKALTEIPDSEKLQWPQTPQGQMARFEVHFVKGAPNDCRRYVVTVTKDRWSTTAQPMEKCGIATPAEKRAG